MKSYSGKEPIVCDASSEQVQCWKYHNGLEGDKEHQLSVLYENIRHLHTAAMERAIETMIKRHESLRTCFRMMGRKLKQYIVPYDKSLFSPLCLDLSGDEQCQKAVDEVVDAFKTELKKTDVPPLVRFGILKISGDTHLLCVVIHHLIADAWSKPILYTELRRFYGAYSTGMDVEALPLDFQLRDYANWQKEWLKKNKKSAQAYWAQKIAGLNDAYRIERLHERSGYSARIPNVNNNRGRVLQRQEMLELLDNGRVCSYVYSIRSPLYEQLLKLSRCTACSPQAILNASLRLLFYLLMNKDKLLIPMLVVSRFVPGSEKLIGYLVGGIYLHRSLDREMPVCSLIKDTYREFFESSGNIIFDHDEMKLDGHRLRLNSDVFVNYLKNDIIRNNGPLKEEARFHRVVETGGYYLLSYTISEYENGLQCNCCYHTGIYPAEIIEFMEEKHRLILQAMCHNPTFSVQQLTDTLSVF